VLHQVGFDFFFESQGLKIPSVMHVVYMFTQPASTGAGFGGFGGGGFGAASTTGAFGANTGAGC
jgi:hypothetical protein